VFRPEKLQLLGIKSSAEIWNAQRTFPIWIGPLKKGIPYLNKAPWRDSIFR